MGELLGKDRHTYTQAWTSKCSVITSSQHGGKLRESPEPREKRIMGSELGCGIKTSR